MKFTHQNPDRKPSNFGEILRTCSFLKLPKELYKELRNNPGNKKELMPTLFLHDCFPVSTVTWDGRFFLEGTLGDLSVEFRNTPPKLNMAPEK